MRLPIHKIYSFYKCNILTVIFVVIVDYDGMTRTKFYYLTITITSYTLSMKLYA